MSSSRALILSLVFVTTHAIGHDFLASTYYVDGAGGDDSNAGTLLKPFESINLGPQLLIPGDTLYLRAGTYSEPLINNIPSGSSWSAPVTLAAYSGETVTLKPPAGTDRVLHFDGSSTQFISIEGLILDGINVR